MKPRTIHFQYKPCIVTRDDGTEVEYESQRHATDAEGIPQAYISRLCRGLDKTYKGMKARFKYPLDSKRKVVNASSLHGGYDEQDEKVQAGLQGDQQG